mgnify:FL=1
MECFYHSSQSAVGVCKSCQRGICRACAGEVGNGIACKDRCEEEAEKLNRLVQQSHSLGARSIKLTNSVSILSVELLNVVLGIIFGGLGIYQGSRFMQLLGGVFLLFGAAGLLRIWKASRPDKKEA